MSKTVLGVIGGSGVYEIPGLENAAWQTVKSPWGQPSDQLLTDGKAKFGQRTGKMALTLAHPQQRRFGIATDRRLHQRGECLQKPRFCLDLRFASASRLAYARRMPRLCTA